MVNKLELRWELQSLLSEVFNLCLFDSIELLPKVVNLVLVRLSSSKHLYLRVRLFRVLLFQLVILIDHFSFNSIASFRLWRHGYAAISHLKLRLDIEQLAELAIHMAFKAF